MKLSIITINYNNKAGLEKTIESVMSQTWRDFEWIIIDGGSTDGSKEVIEGLSLTLSRREGIRNPLTYWCSEPDKGIYNAMNKGITHAKGDYINFMNSGDCFFKKDTIEVVVPYLEKGESDIMFGDWVFSNGKGEKRYMQFLLPIDIYGLYCKNICHQAMFIRGELLHQRGYNEAFKLLADYERWIIAALEGASFKHINEIICIYDTNGACATNFKLKEEEKRRIEALYPSLIKQSIYKLNFYETSHQVRRLKAIINKGGIALKLTNIFLKIMDICFLHLGIKKDKFIFEEIDYNEYYKRKEKQHG